jgi:hypothetical protein
MTPDFEELRWFPLPCEALAELRGQVTGEPQHAPSVVLHP